VTALGLGGNWNWQIELHLISRIVCHQSPRCEICCTSTDAQGHGGSGRAAASGEDRGASGITSAARRGVRSGEVWESGIEGGKERGMSSDEYRILSHGMPSKKFSL